MIYIGIVQKSVNLDGDSGNESEYVHACIPLNTLFELVQSGLTDM